MVETALAAPRWAAEFVGLPFAEHGRTLVGCDCWGLVRLVVRARKRVVLPSYTTEYGGTATEADRRQVAAMVAGKALHTPEVDAGQEEECDAVLLRMPGQPGHVGVVVGGGWMLHSFRGAGYSQAECYRTVKWAKRVMGFYRVADGIDT